MQLSRQDLLSLFITPGQDWSNKVIIAVLERKGFSLEGIEDELGKGRGSIRNVFYRKCPAYQEVVAQKIGVSPDVIWPSRYSSGSRVAS